MLGVIFFLYRMKDVGLYVTLFALGHSATLLLGVLPADGLVPNMIAFNVGVELGQLLALGMILVVMRYWRSTPSVSRHALTGNFALMAASFTLAGYQLTGFLNQ